MQKNLKRRKKIVLLYTLLLLGMGMLMMGSETKAKSIPITKKNFPDKYVRKEIKKYDKNENGALEKKENKKLEKLTLYKKKGNLNIKGLSKCGYLKKLNIDIRGRLLNEKELGKVKKLQIYSVGNANKTIDISTIKNVEKLYLWSLSNIEKITVTGTKKLKVLDIENCRKLRKIQINENSKLSVVNIKDSSQIKKVEIINNKKLKRIDIRAGKKLKEVVILKATQVRNILIANLKKTIKRIEIGNMPKLEKFTMFGTALEKIELNKMKNLKFLWLSDNDNFDNLDFSQVSKLKTLWMEDSQIEELDISNTQIKELNWTDGKLKSLKVNNAVIERLDLQNNQLSGIWDLNQYPRLNYFDCDNNKIEKIIATNHKHLTTVSCENNDLQEFNGTNAWDFYIFHGKGNPNAKLYFYYPKEDSHTNYSFDRTATVYYDTNG